MIKTKNIRKTFVNPVYIFTLVSFCCNICVAAEEIDYINAIDKKVKDQEYREAVKLMNKYELSIVSRFPKPTYSDGFFKCSKTGISFHSPFDDWKTMSEEELEIDRNQLLQAGCDILFMLEKPDEKRQLLLLSLDMRGLLRGMFGEEDVKSMFNDIDMIKNQTVQFGSFFGAVEDVKSRKMNDYDLIIQKIADVPGEAKISIYIIHKQGRLFLFAMKDKTDEMKQFQDDLMVLLNSVQIELFEQKTSIQDTDIVSNLKQVSALEQKGELHDAMELLKDVRDMAKSKMPRAEIQGTKCIFPSYGVSIQNPDSDKFKLEVDNSTPGMSMAFLQEKYSVNEEGIIVMIIDFALSYSPAYLETIKKDDQVKRDLLVGAGRGGSMNIGEMIQEKFVPFKGEMAYEAIVKMAAVNNMKARVLVIPSRDYDFAVIMMNTNSSYEFEKKLEEYNTIIKNNVVMPVKEK